MKNKRDTKTAMQNLRKARKALHALPASDTETPEYQRLNNAVLKAEKAVPWWRR